MNKPIQLKNVLSLSLIRRIKNIFSSRKIERKMFQITDPEIELFLFERKHKCFSLDEAYAILSRYVSEKPEKMDFSTIDVILAEIVMISNYYESGKRIAPLRNEMQIQRIKLLDSILYTCKMNLLSIFRKQKRKNKSIVANLFLKKDYHLTETQFRIIIDKVDALLPCKNSLNSMNIYHGPDKVEDLSIEELCIVSIFLWNKALEKEI